MQFRKDVGQKVRAKRMQDAHPNHAAQEALAVLGQCDDVLHVSQDGSGAPGDLLPNGGQEHFRSTAFHELNAELLLQFAKLAAQRGLSDMGEFGGPTEMKRVGDRHEIAELLKRGHPDDPSLNEA